MSDRRTRRHSASVSSSLNPAAMACLHVVGDWVGMGVGGWLGSTVGAVVGGELLGDRDGVGWVVGDPVGLKVVGGEVKTGDAVGNAVGDPVGFEVVGEAVGATVGPEVDGIKDGAVVGTDVLGQAVGEVVGGASVGEVVGVASVGISVGTPVGDVVGASVVQPVQVNGHSNSRTCASFEQLPWPLRALHALALSRSWTLWNPCASWWQVSGEDVGRGVVGTDVGAIVHPEQDTTHKSS